MCLVFAPFSQGAPFLCIAQQGNGKMSEDYQLESRICGYCGGDGHNPPGATGAPDGPCPECSTYQMSPHNLPPGRKPLTYYDGDHHTDYERRARALARA